MNMRCVALLAAISLSSPLQAAFMASPVIRPLAEEIMANSSFDPSNQSVQTYREKFLSVRNHPALVRGRKIPGLDVNCKRSKASGSGAYSGFTLGNATGNNHGHFTLYTPDGSIGGRADQFVSYERGEAVYVLGEIREFPGPRPSSLTAEQVDHVADFIQTIRSTCWEGTLPIQTYVLYRP